MVQQERIQDYSWVSSIGSNNDNNSTYSERQTWANTVDQDQPQQNAACDQGLHCLPLIHQFYTHSLVVKLTWWREVKAVIMYTVS